MIPYTRRPVFALTAIASALLAVWYLWPNSSPKMDNASSSPPTQAPPPRFTFEILPKLFQQSDPSTNPTTFNPFTENFGLIHRHYPTDHEAGPSSTDWQRVARYIHYLQQSAGSTTYYKVFYLGRHGQGYHNVAETFYGTPAWDAYWSKLRGNETTTWFDAHLTPTGETQALTAQKFIDDQLHPRLMPVPDNYYVSPLHRCLQTAQLTWTNLEFDLPPSKPFHPTIKELLRETLGVHTCDARSSKSEIQAAFPQFFTFEEGFTEEDELWSANHRETNEEHDVRTRKLLEEIFETDEGVFLSLTSHSGAIASFLRVVGHREFPLPTGGMIAVVVEANKVG